MKIGKICCAGKTPAVHFAAEHLRQLGLNVTDTPSMDTRHLLLDVPSFGANGDLRSGDSFSFLMEQLPENVVIYGGNLTHPAVDRYTAVDFLQDEEYLAENAAITADCALRVALPMLTTSLQDSPALVIGWGRIGKCLAQMLKQVGCSVTVAARRSSDRAILKALGFDAVHTAEITDTLKHYRVLFNTVPSLILNLEQLALCSNCVKIDLASRKGLAGADVVWARGLPGIHAPESSGILIAKTFIRMCKEVAK